MLALLLIILSQQQPVCHRRRYRQAALRQTQPPYPKIRAQKQKTSPQKILLNNIFYFFQTLANIPL
jgi:hypothetical protein